MLEEPSSDTDWWRQKRWWLPGVLLLLLVVGDAVAAFSTPDKDLRASILGFMTPLVALVAGGAALLNFQETRHQNQRIYRTTQRQLELSREQFAEQVKLQSRGQVTERFSKAVEQLGQPGPDKRDVRIGGIYALEQIARDSEELHWPIVQILTTFVRERVRGGDVHAAGQLDRSETPSDSLRADFQAAIAVLAHLDRKHDHGQLDLRRSQLQRLELNGDDAHLERADFSGAGLEYASFHSAHLEGADFNGARLDNAIFDSAGLNDAIFSGAALREAVFDNAQLVGARWEAPPKGLLAGLESRQPTQLQGAKFLRANAPGAKFDECELNNAAFAGASLEKASFWNAQLRGATFEEAQLQGAYFGGEKTDLRAANFDNAHLSDAKFHGAQLQKAWMKGAEMQKSEFDDAHLEGADLSFSQIQDASFARAQLQYARFWEADLQRARFWNAHLEGASFGNASLQGADFTGAKVDGTSFDEAKLDGTIFSTQGEDGTVYDAAGLQVEQLTLAASLEGVVLPSYMPRDAVFPARPVDARD